MTIFRDAEAHILRRAPAARVLIMALALLLLGGCGKKGPLEPPAGVPSTYPRDYPSE